MTVEEQQAARYGLERFLHVDVWRPDSYRVSAAAGGVACALLAVSGLLTVGLHRHTCRSLPVTPVVIDRAFTKVAPGALVRQQYTWSHWW